MYISDKDLKELKNVDKDDIFEVVEDMDENEELSLNIDKMWDVLHFVFTGISATKRILNNPLSEAIVGEYSIEDVSEFIADIDKSSIREIVLVLENVGFKKAMENFSMKACKKAELYPNIWEYEEETELIKEELAGYFNTMKEFYKKILEQNGNVLVTIY